MRLHGRTVDEELRRRTPGPRKRMEEVHPNTLGGPADVTIVEGLAGTINARRIDPARARLEHMHDTADHPPIVDPRPTPPPAGEHRLNPRPLLGAEPVTLSQATLPTRSEG